MSVELWSLFAVFGVMLFSVLAQGTYLDLRAGIPYVLSSRAEPPPNHGPLGARLDRNVRNQVEGLALFLPLVLISATSGISNGWTENAALAYAASRAAYVPSYAFDLVPVRTLIWAAGLASLFAFAWGLTTGALTA